MIVKKMMTLVPVKNKLVRTSEIHIEPDVFSVLRSMFARQKRQDEERREASRVRRILGWPPYGSYGGGFMVPTPAGKIIIDALKRLNA